MDLQETWSRDKPLAIILTVSPGLELLFSGDHGVLSQRFGESLRVLDIPGFLSAPGGFRRDLAGLDSILALEQVLGYQRELPFVIVFNTHGALGSGNMIDNTTSSNSLTVDAELLMTGISAPENVRSPFQGLNRLLSNCGRTVYVVFGQCYGRHMADACTKLKDASLSTVYFLGCSYAPTRSLAKPLYLNGAIVSWMYDYAYHEDLMCLMAKLARHLERESNKK